MSDAKRIDLSLHPRPLLRTGQLDKRNQSELSKADEQNEIVREPFAAALEAYPKAQAAASQLGMTEAYLSQMKSGERTIPLRAVLPLLDNENSATVLLTWLCEKAGFAPPARPKRVNRRQVEKKTTQKVKQVVQLWSMVRAEVAAELNTSVMDVERALEETTNPGVDPELVAAVVARK